MTDRENTLHFFVVPMKKQYYAFTLIEMLIVIVIIGILAAALIPRLQAVQGRARDSKRKVDLRTIYNANEIYFLDAGKYAQAGCGLGLGCAVSSTGGLVVPWIPELSGVLTTLPKDPINNYADVYFGNYTYTYGWIFNTPVWTYDIITLLENRQDPERCTAKNYKFFADTLDWCPYNAQIYDLSPNVKNVYN